MASRLLTDLLPQAEEAAKKTVEECKRNGVNLLIYCTLRSLDEQAKLYRQSRLLSDIQSKAKELELSGYGFLAKILIDVGPQPGKVGAHVTKATPGQSWHNFGMAFDAVPLGPTGKAIWATSHPDWKIYGKCSVANGLNWGGNWTSFKDYPHSQMTHGPNPMHQYAPQQMKDLLIKIFNLSGKI